MSDTARIERESTVTPPDRLCRACGQIERIGINPLCDYCAELIPSIINGDGDLSAGFVQEALRRPMKPFAVLAYVLSDYGFAEYGTAFRDLHDKLVELDGEIPMALDATQQQK